LKFVNWMLFLSTPFGNKHLPPVLPNDQEASVSKPLEKDPSSQLTSAPNFIHTLTCVWNQLTYPHFDVMSAYARQINQNSLADEVYLGISKARGGE
jgi:hypothetical protein